MKIRLEKLDAIRRASASKLNFSFKNDIENLKNCKSTTQIIWCYQMVNEEDKILCIGKAKNIQNRLESYLNPNNLSNRIRRLCLK